MFRAKAFHRTSFEGDITQAEWSSGPRQRRLISPFVTLDDILPSRFALAFDSILDVAFVALDPERIGDAVDDGMVTDLGDNVLTYNTNFTVNDRVRETGDDDEDEEDDDSDTDSSDSDDSDTDSSDSDEDEEAAELLTGKTTSLNTLIQFLSYDDVHE